MKISEINQTQNLETNEQIYLREKRSFRDEGCKPYAAAQLNLETNFRFTEDAREYVKKIHSNTTNHSKDYITVKIFDHVENIRRSYYALRNDIEEIESVCSTNSITENDRIYERISDSTHLIEELLELARNIKNPKKSTQISTTHKAITSSTKKVDLNLFSNENLYATQSNINTNFSVANKNITAESSTPEKKITLGFSSIEKSLKTELTTEFLKTKEITTKELTTKGLTTKELTTKELTTKELTTKELTTKELETTEATTGLKTTEATTGLTTKESTKELETTEATTGLTTTGLITVLKTTEATTNLKTTGLITVLKKELPTDLKRESTTDKNTNLESKIFITENIEIEENNEVKLNTYNESNSFSSKNIPLEVIIILIMFCLIIISLSVCSLLCFNSKKEKYSYGKRCC